MHATAAAYACQESRQTSYSIVAIGTTVRHTRGNCHTRLARHAHLDGCFCYLRTAVEPQSLQPAEAAEAGAHQQIAPGQGQHGHGGRDDLHSRAAIRRGAAT